MPRRARLLLPNVPLHIIQRGNNRQACFYADEDYNFYLTWLREYADKTGCRIHAYALMTNHVHLLISADQTETPGALMKALGQRYVQYVNRTYRRSGTLWEGRFRSCLIQEESYLLSCYRYIELNPVRANMVEHPEQYRWPSYKTWSVPDFFDSLTFVLLSGGRYGNHKIIQQGAGHYSQGVTATPSLGSRVGAGRNRYCRGHIVGAQSSVPAQRAERYRRVAQAQGQPEV